MIQVDEMKAGGNNATKGGYFYHTVGDIDIGIPDYELLIIQEMHNAVDGKIQRQSIGIGMFCFLQYTTYQNRDKLGRFKKKIEFFGKNQWKGEQAKMLKKEMIKTVESKHSKTSRTWVREFFGGN